MERKNNIWGRAGCELPNGKLCSACCVLPDIELEGALVSVGKPANSPCPYLDNDGCQRQLAGKPDTCNDWHCSIADLGGKLNLVAQTLSLGQVDEDSAIEAVVRLTGTSWESAQKDVLERSAYLSKITQKRELVTRDLDET